MVCLGSVGKFWLDESLEVKVNGSWLKEFGFEYGRKVVVEVTEGQIVIKAVDIDDMSVIKV
jgi:formylmethanofuran dehydrogenase subunit D